MPSVISSSRHGAERTGSVLGALALLMGLSACHPTGPASSGTAPVPPTTLAQVGEYPPGTGVWKGYLAAAAWPDSLALLPAPPVPNTPPYQADEYMFLSTRTLEQGPRGKVAIADADLHFPHAPNQMACALGLDIDANRSPHLYALMARSFADAGLSTYKAKNYYQRVRPFVVNHTSTCTPAEDAMLAKDGSYPSGHTAISWTWALLLSEVSPEHTNALLQRGLAFGQSRVICGAHWQSDVDNARLVAAGVVARLHSEPVFLAQLALAKKEVETLRQTVKGSTRDCAAEAEALRLGNTSPSPAALASDKGSAPSLPPSLTEPPPQAKP